MCWDTSKCPQSFFEAINMSFAHVHNYIYIFIISLVASIFFMYVNQLYALMHSLNYKKWTGLGDFRRYSNSYKAN